VKVEYVQLVAAVRRAASGIIFIAYHDVLVEMDGLVRHKK